MLQRTLPAGFIAPCLATKTDLERWGEKIGREPARGRATLYSILLPRHRHCGCIP